MNEGNVPVTAAEDIAYKYAQKQVIIFSYDGDITSITTFGVSAADSARAASGANQLKAYWGWPENTIVESAKVQALYDRIAELEAQLDHYDNERRR